jgi:hypothetical protein
MNSLLYIILADFLLIIVLFIIFVKIIYRKGVQSVKINKSLLEIDNVQYDLLNVDKIILSSNYYGSNKPAENELVIVSPIFDDFYRFRHYYSFDMIQYSLNNRPSGYLYLWHWNKNQIENLLKSILIANKNIILEGKGLKKLNLNK